MDRDLRDWMRKIENRIDGLEASIAFMLLLLFIGIIIVMASTPGG